MPIPPTSEIRKCKSELALNELYAREPYRWTRGTLTYDRVGFHARLRSWTITRYEIDTNRLEVCGCGEKNRLFVRLMPSGIVMTCASCRCTFGILTEAQPAFTNLGTRRASLKEIYETLSKTGQQPPPGLPELQTDHLAQLR